MLSTVKSCTDFDFLKKSPNKTLRARRITNKKNYNFNVMLMITMKQKYNFKSWLMGALALVFVFGMAQNSNAQEELINETLRNGSLPTGWSQVDVTFATAAGGYANFTSINATLTTPVFDASEFATVEVETSVAKFGSGVDGPITVEYSLDGGDSWLVAGTTSTPTSSTYLDDTTVISAVSETMVVRFTRPDSPSQKRLRDVVITGMPAPEDPFLAATPTSISDFGYNTIDGGPSASQSFSLSGSNLDPADAAITITAPANFEISLDDVSFGDSRTLNAAGGELESTTIFVRLIDGLTTGSYSGNVSITGGGADEVTVSLSGMVEEPLTAVLPFAEGFESDLSGVYVFRVSGANNWNQGSFGGRTFARMNGFNTGQVENTWLILPGFDFSETSDETMRFETRYNFGSDDEDNFLKLWYSTDYPGLGDPSAFSWTELEFDRPASSQTIVPSGNVDLTGIDASSVYIAFQYNYEPGNYREWRVYDIEVFESGAPELTLKETTLTGLNYFFGSGPSESGEVLVSGTNLEPASGTITITGSANFEVSVDEIVWDSSATFNYGRGEFADQDVYVRLVEGLDIGDYENETITISGGGASDVTITVSGSVSAVPPGVVNRYTQQFRNFENAETLPQGWSVSNSTYNGNWGTGTGAGLRGNNSVLGFQHTGGTGTFTTTLELLNDTGDEITDLFISYTGRVARADQGRSPIWTVEVNGDEVAGLAYSTEDNLETSQYVHLTGLSVTEGAAISISWSSTRGAGGGSSKQIGISDVVVSTTPFIAASILGTQGYRILASPAENATYGQVLSTIWTQGYDGAAFPGGNSNVFVYNEQTNEFTTPGNADNRMGTVSNTESSAGKASLVYVFADDNRNMVDDPFPKLLLYDGESNSGDVSLSLSFTGDGAPEDNGWHLVGNPYSGSLDWTSITDNERNNNISDVFYIYDSEIDAYRLINGAPEEGSDNITHINSLIAPHQGGWVKVLSDAGGTLEFKEDDLSAGGAELYNTPEELPFVRFNLSAGDRSDYAAVVFREDAAAGIDRRDAYQLAPLSNRFAHIYTRTGDAFLMVENLPVGKSEYIIPVGINSSMEETHMLTWNDMNTLSLDFDVFLIDNVTGERINLRDSDSYTFEHIPNTGTGSAKSALENMAERRSPVMSSENKSPERFTLEITMTGTSSPIGGDLPRELALDQNYPNPFNPTTQIRYDLPESADVRLDVFNIQGQRVATLVSSNQSAGRYNVNFDASALASGVYIYRLQAGNNVMTRKMTLIK